MQQHKKSSPISTDNFFINKQTNSEYIIALAGNPNVGKSTLFNALTKMNQHTGNWSGKTVACAKGNTFYKEHHFIFIDLPGTYSLMAHSPEEEVARNFIKEGIADIVLVICDATCLERNMNLVLQTLNITKNVIVCINLMDEADKKGIKINLQLLEDRLFAPVIGISAREKHSTIIVLDTLLTFLNDKKEPMLLKEEAEHLARKDENEYTIFSNENAVFNSKEEHFVLKNKNERNSYHTSKTNTVVTFENSRNNDFKNKIDYNEFKINDLNYSKSKIDYEDLVVTSLIHKAEQLCDGVITYHSHDYFKKQQKIDKFLTRKSSGIPVMLLLLYFIFWLTIEGANIPSRLLSTFLFYIEDLLSKGLQIINTPTFLHGALIFGIYRVTAWVIAVMLPPMAIFFPLFTLLEDSGYLPRIAFNLDYQFKKACACGKQCLTSCMGLGCNAAGVVGCRIIDSKRERLIAIITNSLIPCNGRIPTLIAMINMFFVATLSNPMKSILGSFLLLSTILFSFFMTFQISKLLSNTILKGMPSSFTLELPPYRKPQIKKVIIRSIFDRTLQILARAAIVSAPAGLLLFILTNVTIYEQSLFHYFADFLNPFALYLGLDGKILMAFILGFPANEIVIPIIIMAYTSSGSLMEWNSLIELKELFLLNGWTPVTAICVMLFCLMHWPCSTTCLTIKKETKSMKWTLISIFIPTILGMIMCFFVHSIATLFM